jgi:hypothetical protein
MPGGMAFLSAWVGVSGDPVLRTREGKVVSHAGNTVAHCHGVPERGSDGQTTARLKPEASSLQRLPKSPFIALVKWSAGTSRWYLNCYLRTLTRPVAPSILSPTPQTCSFATAGTRGRAPGLVCPEAKSVLAVLITGGSPCPSHLLQEGCCPLAGSSSAGSLR